MPKRIRALSISAIAFMVGFFGDAEEKGAGGNFRNYRSLRGWRFRRTSRFPAQNCSSSHTPTRYELHSFRYTAVYKHFWVLCGRGYSVGSNH